MHKIKSQIACSVSKLSIILDDFPLNQEHKSLRDIQFPKCWILGIFGFMVVYNGYLSVSVCSIKHINVWGTPETGIISSTCLLTELRFIIEIFLKAIWRPDSGLVLQVPNGVEIFKSLIKSVTQLKKQHNHRIWHNIKD